MNSRRLWRRSLLGVVGAGLLLSIGNATAQVPTRAGSTEPPVPSFPVVQGTIIPAGSEVNSGIGTISYDNNVPFQRSGTIDGTIGNTFAPTAATHTLTTVTFRLAGNFGSTAVVSAWNPTALTLITRFGVAGFPGGGGAGTTAVTGIAALPAPIVQNAPFIAGIHNTYSYAACNGQTALNFVPGCDGVALTEGATDPGAGFHAVRVDGTFGFVPTGSTANGTTAIPNQNAIFRVTGNNLPVELMSFSVESE